MSSLDIDSRKLWAVVKGLLHSKTSTVQLNSSVALGHAVSFALYFCTKITKIKDRLFINVLVSLVLR